MKGSDLEKLVDRELGELGFECVKLEVIGTPQSPIVRLYIDKEGGVTISDCARVSRALGVVLDREDPIAGRYLLEVSSPGSSRPLTREEHYNRFVGSLARVHVTDAEVGKKTYTGNIRSCINGVLTLDTEDGQQLIHLADVLKANLSGREYKIDKKKIKKTKQKGDAR